MRNSLLTLFFLISFIQASLGQVTTATSYNDTVYSVGDTIQLGVPRYSSDRYDFILYPDKKNDIIYHRKLDKENFSFTYAVIENITPREQNDFFSFTEKSPLLQVRCYEKSDSILFINLDYAIAQKEIVLNLKKQQTETTPLKIHTLLAFYYRIHKKEITDELLLQYINSQDPQLGKECAENRFKFQKIKAEWQAVFEKEKADLNFNKVYYIETPVNHSEYDFEKQGYWISYDSKIYKQDKDIIPVEPYYFRLQNLAKKNLLPMQPDIAEKFEVTQKGISYYRWLGTLYARIFFRFSKAPVVFPKTDTGIAMSIIYKDSLMDVEIDKVDVFDHDSYRYNYVGTIK